MRTSSASRWSSFTSKSRMSMARSDRHRLLVGAIARGERVEDVGDAHHLGLERDLLGAQPIRVARAVEPLVVRAGDDGDPRNAFPQGIFERNLNVCVTWLRISSNSSRRERAARHAEARPLVGVEQELHSRRACRSRSRARSPRSSRSRRREHRRLVGGHDGRPDAVELGAALGELPVERVELRFGRAALERRELARSTSASSERAMKSKRRESARPPRRRASWP